MLNSMLDRISSTSETCEHVKMLTCITKTTPSDPKCPCERNMIVLHQHWWLMNICHDFNAELGTNEQLKDVKDPSDDINRSSYPGVRL